MTLTTLLAALIVTAQVPPATGFVNDQAEVLTPAEEAAIIAVCEEFERVTTIEVAVLTMPSIDSETPREFATKALNAWGVGKAGKDNGVLLLLAKQERRVEIEVGYGLEGELTDGLSGELLDAYVIPRFKEGRFGQGLVDGVTGIARLLSSGRVQGPRAGAASPPRSTPASAPPVRHAPTMLPPSSVDVGFTMPLRWWLAAVLAFGFLLAVTLHKDPNKPFVPWTMWLLLIPLAFLTLPVVLSFGLAPLWVNTLAVAVWAWWIWLCVKTKPWLTTCSKCAKRQVSSTTKTVVAATYSSGGQDRVTETCGACRHTTSSLRNTSRKTRSSSSSYSSSSGSSYRSSSSSSSGSRSFGGGSSGGGGAGRSW